MQLWAFIVQGERTPSVWHTRQQKAADRSSLLDLGFVAAHRRESPCSVFWLTVPPLATGTGMLSHIGAADAARRMACEAPNVENTLAFRLLVSAPHQRAETSHLAATSL
jgi:hypothetical protein